ncbi:unnamed protein product [Cylindrotheca closterium]|uniref:DUF6824 domain-containing protein n=1 Tax=Cylindrotheca closterium TaxID=2856 RepID=A0AAD2JKM6_9STRA|nr:unnamed protein product [Cylindrotheca closterium]
MTMGEQPQQNHLLEAMESSYTGSGSSGSHGGGSIATDISIEAGFTRSLNIQDLPSEEFNAPQETVDFQLAEELNGLSMQQRDQALHEIHGISAPIEESPELVMQKRMELDAALRKLAAKKSSSAYRLAVAVNPGYVSSESLQLMFLRSEEFDASNTAKKMVKFFEAKLELFGSDAMQREIRLNDLSKDDKRSLESGFFQVLPSRDVAGRAIIVGLPMLRKYKKLENLVRAFWYTIFLALQDVQTQKNGFVMIGFNTGKNRVMDRGAAWAVQKIARLIPMRMSSIHFCYDALTMKPMMTVAMMVMGARRRVRFRSHYGTCKEHRYKLLTFGLPVGAMPVTEDGEPKTKAHRAWVKSLQQQEENSTMSKNIIVPGRFDVLFGRGKPIQEHYGNLRYHSLLDNYQSEYEQAKKFDKMEIAQKTVDQVHSYAGRFLKQEGAVWIAVDDSVAREKVSHAFRTRRSTANA